jgi:formylglycine-generating enzyme required for sulfatase activity
MPRIFISYRREDSIAYAGRIYDRLSSQFGAANVFMDVDTLEPGVDFVEVLQRTVASCDVFLAIVGVHWLAAKDEEGRARLSNTEDFVRLKIGAALERPDIRVVPILVGGARMPRSTELPERLSDLTKRQALVLPDIGFHQAFGRLIQSIERAEQERLAREKAEAAQRAEQERLDREDADRKKREAARPVQDGPIGGMTHGKGEGSRSRLLAYVLGGLAAVLAAVWFVIAHDNVRKPVLKVEPRATQQPDTGTSAPAPKTEPEPPLVRQSSTNPKDGLPYAWIPPGKFTMGCSPGDTECDSDEKPPHVEQIANGFWLGQTEVTQTAWKKVMGGDNPSHFKSDQLPVESVDWNQARAYCKAIGGWLPTEKQWEYAARAGTTGPRYGKLDAVAWNSGNSGGTTHPVALKQANAYGLYDMLGDVWEWTADDYDAGRKVFRGGSWNLDSRFVRASFRHGYRPAIQDVEGGFRCVGELR